MRVDLQGVRVGLLGDVNPVTELAVVRMQANGAVVAWGDTADVPDILVISLPLIPIDGLVIAPLQAVAGAAGDAMAARGRGRIIFILSAVAAIPMRRHPDYSMQMGAMLTLMRTLAMRLGPGLQVNAVGVGAIGDPLIAGDAAMIGHASVGRPGTVEEVADTVLFLCDPANTYLTGQMLSVDGGWSAGYGRNF